MDDAELSDILARTGHDVHFLSRLERVTLDQTELALRLYRDPALVRDLLGDAACPPGERVALALADGGDPPHIIVARDGAFVTCLGAGMLPAATPELPWQRVEIHLRRADLERARTARADQVLDDDRRAQRLLDRIQRDGAALSRESFAELAAVEPVLQSHFTEELLVLLPTVLRVGGGIARSRSARSDDDLLHRFWRLYYACCHLVLLSFLGGWRSFEFWVRPEIEAEGTPLRKFLRIAQIGGSPLTLRLLWAMGRGGKHALPAIKAALAAAPDLVAWTFPAIALVNIALSHRRLRAEVQSALGPTRLPPQFRDDPDVQRFLVTLRGLLDDGKLRNENDPEQQELYARGFAADAVIALAGKSGEIDPAAGLGNPLMPTIAASVVFDCVYGSAMAMPATLMISSAMATSPAERFYFPAEHVPTFAPRYSPASALAIARCIGGEAIPARAAEKVGRNEPCPCKSGRKYKKCCGAAA